MNSIAIILLLFLLMAKHVTMTFTVNKVITAMMFSYSKNYLQ